MKKENIQFLELHKPIYDTLVKAGFIQNLTNEVRQRFLNIIHEEFSPTYLCCLHCSEDVLAMVRYVYIQYLKKCPPQELNPIAETKPPTKPNGRAKRK